VHTVIIILNYVYADHTKASELSMEHGDITFIKINLHFEKL